MDATLARLHRLSGQPPAQPRRIDRWAAGVVAALLALGGLAAALGSLQVRRVPPPQEGEAAVTINGRSVALPAAWLRERSSGGALLEIPLSAFAGAGAPAGSVWVRIGPADGSLAPADRVASLYARFLSPDAVSDAGGLIRRDFRPGTPYEGEVLLVAPPDGRAFAARCTVGAVREACLAEIRAGGSDLQVRLAPEHLVHWQAVARGLARLAGR